MNVQSTATTPTVMAQAVPMALALLVPKSVPVNMAQALALTLGTSTILLVVQTRLALQASVPTCMGPGILVSLAVLVLLVTRQRSTTMVTTMITPALDLAQIPERRHPVQLALGPT